MELSRRKLTGGIAGAIVGGAGTTAYFTLRTEGVPPTEPDGDGEATLGELHYLLESVGPEGSRVEVTTLTYSPDEDVITVTYTSAAQSASGYQSDQHIREVGQVTRMFSEYVRQDGNDGKRKGSKLEARVENPAAQQVHGYHIERTWMEKLNSGEWSDKKTLGEILSTGYQEHSVTVNGSS